MDTTFVRNRITELRTRKGVSEYKMSQDLDHSKSYIQSISSGKALPSLSEFLYICEYLGVTPSEFFDLDSVNPSKLNSVMRDMKKLNDQQLDIIAALVRDMTKK